MNGDNKLIYDCGIHRGEDTAYYAKLGYRVVAFEANPSLAEECRRRFSREIDSGRVTVVEGAIAPADHGDRVTFYVSSETVWGTIKRDFSETRAIVGADFRPVTVPRTDMLAVLRKTGVPYYLKIDIEGADSHVLQCIEEFGERPRFISLESDKVNFSALIAELDTLKRLGYSKFKVVQQAGIGRSLIRTTALDGTPVEHTFEIGASGPFGDDLPGRWLTYDEAIARYESVFRAYRSFGDHSILRRHKIGRVLLTLLGRLLKRPIPGWYDTHATY